MNVRSKNFFFYSLLVFSLLNLLFITIAVNSPRIKILIDKQRVFAAGSTFYVSPNGNDSNPGTQSRPWKTLQKASISALSGDTVIILPGTYREKLIPANSGTDGNYITYTATPGTVIIDGSGLTLNSSDSKGDGLVQIIGKSYIKIQGLTLRNSSVNCLNISANDSGTRPSYIEVTGLDIQNCRRVGIKVRLSNHLLVKDNSIKHTDYSSGIGVWSSEDVVVDNNNIDTPHWYHECQGAYEEGLTISNVNRFEVKNNILNYTETPPSGYCDNSQRLGIDVKESSQNGSVHNNSVTNFDAGGIYIDGWHAGANGTPTLNHINIYKNRVQNGGGIVVGCEQADGVVEYVNIYNNLVVNTYYSGIQVRGAWGNGLRKNINIYNNTIYGANPNGGNGGAGIYVTTSNLGSNNSDKPVIIRNNISNFYFLSSGGGTVGQIRSGNSTMANLVTADHNIVYGPMSCSQEYPNCVELGSRTTFSPTALFVNPGSLNLSLKNNSPAINTGSTINLVTDDYDSIRRPQGSMYDIGAYEFITNTVPTVSIPTSVPTNNPTAVPTGTITSTPQPTGTPASDSSTYEAESSTNTLSGTVTVRDCLTCSGSEAVGWIGNGLANYVRFNNVYASAAGLYNLVIYYMNGGSTDRGAYVSTNSGTKNYSNYAPAGDWSQLGTKTVTVNLSAGNNTITFGNDSAYAPDIDRFIVVSSPSVNLLKNYSFEETSSAWYFPWVLNKYYNASVAGTLNRDTSTHQGGYVSARVDITRSSATSWYMQFFQSNIAIASGKSYKISFWAKAQTNKAIQMVVQQMVYPYTTYYRQNINVTNSWQKFNFTFNPRVSNSNVKLAFFLAGYTGNTWFDDIYFGL